MALHIKLNHWSMCKHCLGSGQVKLVPSLYGGMITTDYCPMCSGMGQRNLGQRLGDMKAAFEKLSQSLQEFETVVKKIELKSFPYTPF